MVKAQALLSCLEHMEHESLATFFLYLIERINGCIVEARKHKLPTSAEGHICSSFHQLRFSDDVKQTWTSFVDTVIPMSDREESELVLQLLMDRVLKKLLANTAEAARKKPPNSAEVRPLTTTESNAVRYMAGYVAISLLKRFRKPTRHPQLKPKRNLFVRVLQGMRAADQPENVSSVTDHTRHWSELIDRGGLYHISDEVSESKIILLGITIACSFTGVSFN